MSLRIGFGGGAEDVLKLSRNIGGLLRRTVGSR